MEKFIMDEHEGLTSWSEIIISSPVKKNQSWNQSASGDSTIGAISVRTGAAVTTICS